MCRFSNESNLIFSSRKVGTDVFLVDKTGAVNGGFGLRPNHTRHLSFQAATLTTSCWRVRAWPHPFLLVFQPDTGLWPSFFLQRDNTFCCIMSNISGEAESRHSQFDPSDRSFRDPWKQNGGRRDIEGLHDLPGHGRTLSGYCYDSDPLGSNFRQAISPKATRMLPTHKISAALSVL
jgi:hypothetical protein